MSVSLLSKKADIRSTNPGSGGVYHPFFLFCRNSNSQCCESNQVCWNQTSDLGLPKHYNFIGTSRVNRDKKVMNKLPMTTTISHNLIHTTFWCRLQTAKSDFVVETKRLFTQRAVTVQTRPQVAYNFLSCALCRSMVRSGSSTFNINGIFAARRCIDNTAQWLNVILIYYTWLICVHPQIPNNTAVWKHKTNISNHCSMCFSMYTYCNWYAAI